MSEDKVKVPGLTEDNAVLLLAAAEELGLDHRVVAVSPSEGAFVVPSEVADKAGIGSAKPRKSAAKRTVSAARKSAAKKSAEASPKEEED